MARSHPALEAPLGYATHSDKSLKAVTGQPKAQPDKELSQPAEAGVLKSLVTFLSREDVLKGLSIDELHGWYKRLAGHVGQNDKDSLAAAFMNHWLKADGSLYTYAPSPSSNRIFNSSLVRDYLRRRVRRVLLTEVKGISAGDSKWLGVLPRIKNMQGFPAWDGISPIEMTYMGESVEIPLSVQLDAIQGHAKKEDLDLLMSLHNFAISTKVVMGVARNEMGKTYRVHFSLWQSHAEDRYDFDPKEHLTVPNPDYKNAFGVPNPVAPSSESVKVYHTNAQRLEQAGRAKPFDFRSSEWSPNDMTINGPAIVDSSRQM